MRPRMSEGGMRRGVGFIHGVHCNGERICRKLEESAGEGMGYSLRIIVSTFHIKC